MTNLDNLMDRYTKLDTAMTNLNRDVERSKLQLEMKKTDLQQRMVALQEKGLEFNNLTTLQASLTEIEGVLETNLTSMERKLNDVQK